MNYAELRPGTASAVTDIEHFKWSDAEWMKERATHKEDVYEQPLAIYEVHPGSWMRHPGRQDDGFYSYRDLAKSLIPYVTEMGYSHIELRESANIRTMVPGAIKNRLLCAYLALWNTGRLRLFCK